MMGFHYSAWTSVRDPTGPTPSTEKVRSRPALHVASSHLTERGTLVLLGAPSEENPRAPPGPAGGALQRRQRYQRLRRWRGSRCILWRQRGRVHVRESHGAVDRLRASPHRCGLRHLPERRSPTMRPWQAMARAGRPRGVPRDRDEHSKVVGSSMRRRTSRCPPPPTPPIVGRNAPTAKPGSDCLRQARPPPPALPPLPQRVSVQQHHRQQQQSQRSPSPRPGPARTPYTSAAEA